MIVILLNDNAYEQDIRELLMAFFPGETFGYQPDEQAHLVITQTWREDEQLLELSMAADGKSELATELLAVDYRNRFETKNQMKRCLYRFLQSYTGKELPWGTLTGIRPTKIVMAKQSAGMSEVDIRSYMRDTYYTSVEKIDLSCEIAKREQELLSVIDYQNGYSLYLGIPFCPTTCLYCSFTSYPIGRWKDRTHLYLEALFREMEFVASKKQGAPLDTVYIGGGTPTSLSAADLNCLLEHLETVFDLSGLSELTVEAGRPDSITREKLEVLKRHGVTRISINPQTMQQKTLDIIGRHHSVEAVKECFMLARELGFDNINMDLIIGLPEETIQDVTDTMEQIRQLKPDSITVHTLAIKRAARLNTMKEVYKDLKITGTQEMIEITAAFAREMGMEPYYLYRQKNMAGNFENVGYAMPGKACIYNILIMEEKQTILACGAGTTTKVLYPEENRLERAENVKDVEHYISRVDEMIERKNRLMIER
ncbi:MAG: coproporphyrinogen dehydrogenase HemZ [Lachnospiraceae bacterium]